MAKVTKHEAQLQGEQLKRDWPDVRVVKMWFTCNDDYVCETCRPLNEKTVEIDDEFAEGIAFPPAHDGCRCWMDSTTDILASEP